MSGTDDWLSGFGDMLERHRQQDEAARLEWQERLGPPSATFIDSDDEEDPQEYGCWLLDAGIWVFPKRKNGYHPHEGRFICEEELDVLVKLWTKEKA